MADILHDYLVYLCGAENVRCQEPLARWTTFRVGGPAAYFVIVRQKKQLPRLISALEYLDYPYFLLGLGANVLASDQGFAGVVIKLDFQEIQHNDEFLYADAGAKLGTVASYARDHGLSGLEWSIGIPATIGGAVYMNCGAFNHCMADVVALVDVWVDGQCRTLTANELAYGYRHSIFMEKPMIILGAYLRLHHGKTAEITQKMREIIQKRSNHPKQPSAGSVFKRPRDGFYVGRVIEELGFKGYQLGGAQVSPTHCNFIVNTGHATAHDVWQLITLIQDKVHAATGETIVPEIITLGEI